jgi:hypothetical protein
MKFEGLLKGAAPVVVGILIVGALFYFLGNQPIISQAQDGFSGNTSPTAPAAL